MTRTILLVDDERDSLEPMRVLLEEEYHVLAAYSGKEALEILPTADVEMIIADQRMPGMSGVDLLARVREYYPNMIRLILTAYTDFDAMLKAINAGRVYRYIIKPWDVRDMRLVIRQAFEWKDLLAAKGRLDADLRDAHRVLTQRSLELEAAHNTIVKQEKMAAVGQFASQMVHEIKNYLQVILTLNEYLATTDSEEIDAIMEVQDQALLLNDLATDIMEYAQGSLDIPFRPTATPPARPAEKIIKTCGHHPLFESLDIVINSADLPAWHLDPKQIERLLFNLLKNAAKASLGYGNKEIELSVKMENNELVYRVVDHGKGIPLAARDQIWEPFFTQWTQKGIGLGLCICKQIAETHGGRLQFQETEGGGSTFVLAIPEKK